MIYGMCLEAFGELAKQISFLSRALCDGYDYFNEPSFRYNIKIERSDLYPESLRGIAMDGFRLHLVDPLCSSEGLEEGFWRVIKTSGDISWMARLREDDEKYPDFHKVIPKKGPISTFVLHGLPRGDLLGNMAFLVKFFREFPEPTSINMNYLNSLDPTLEWNVKWYGSKKPVVFESMSYTSVVMPQIMEETLEK
jgi:hypothetical protein